MMFSVVNYWISLIILIEINVLFGFNILDNQYEEVEETNKNDNGLIYYFTS